MKNYLIPTIRWQGGLWAEVSVALYDDKVYFSELEAGDPKLDELAIGSMTVKVKVTNSVSLKAFNNWISKKSRLYQRISTTLSHSTIGSRGNPDTGWNRVINSVNRKIENHYYTHFGKERKKRPQYFDVRSLRLLDGTGKDVSEEFTKIANKFKASVALGLDDSVARATIDRLLEELTGPLMPRVFAKCTVTVEFYAQANGPLNDRKFTVLTDVNPMTASLYKTIHDYYGFTKSWKSFVSFAEREYDMFIEKIHSSVLLAVDSSEGLEGKYVIIKFIKIDELDFLDGDGLNINKSLERAYQRSRASEALG